MSEWQVANFLKLKQMAEYCQKKNKRNMKKKIKIFCQFKLNSLFTTANSPKAKKRIVQKSLSSLNHVQA